MPHFRWAPQATLELGRVLEKQGDTAAARDAYQRAAEMRNSDIARTARERLEQMAGQTGPAGQQG